MFPTYKTVLRFPVRTSLLFSSRNHTSAFTSARAALIVERVQQIAVLFALLTLLFIAADVALLPGIASRQLIVNRIFASAFFMVLAMSCRKATGMPGAYFRLFLLFSTPVIFLVNSNCFLNFPTDNASELFLIGVYAYSPFVIASGVSLFPLTLAEGLLLLGPLAMLPIAVSVMVFPYLYTMSSGSSLVWIQLLILCSSTLSAVSQLGFMLKLFDDTAYDNLTGTFRRKIGTTILDQQFQVALRQRAPFAVIFVDLDHFKQINDRFGHDQGDDVLRQAASAIKAVLRHQDIVIRWGGEEFLIMLPNTNIDQTSVFISRLTAYGFGMRPDGKPVTASIGAAECRADNANDWETLNRLADKRMYMAKEAGRNRHVLHNEAVMNTTVVAGVESGVNEGEEA